MVEHIGLGSMRSEPRRAVEELRQLGLKEVFVMSKVGAHKRIVVNIHLVCEPRHVVTQRGRSPLVTWAVANRCRRSKAPEHVRINCLSTAFNAHVKSTVTRARGGVVPTPGITVIPTPGAAAAAVMPGVSITPGQPEPGEARGGGAKQRTMRRSPEAGTALQRRSAVRRQP